MSKSETNAKKETKRLETPLLTVAFRPRPACGLSIYSKAPCRPRWAGHHVLHGRSRSEGLTTTGQPSIANCRFSLFSAARPAGRAAEKRENRRKRAREAVFLVANPALRWGKPSGGGINRQTSCPAGERVLLASTDQCTNSAPLRPFRHPQGAGTDGRRVWGEVIGLANKTGSPSGQAGWGLDERSRIMRSRRGLAMLELILA